MVLDTSAILAVLLAEPEADAIVRAVALDDRRAIGAPTLVEASAVMLARKGTAGEVALDALLERLGVEVVPMSAAAARLARLAYSRFGKGVGNPAVLNFGDCLAYGVAMSEREPLLCKGDDFRQTDVPTVPY
ncbi:MAG: type II toxin-antitoxin system VapC family toxin [Longimicrobiales bacterium]